MTRVSDLAGAELALWVGRAQGWTYGPPHKIHGWPVWRDKDGEIVGVIPGDAYKPHEDWSQGGPLIEKHKIDLMDNFGHGRRAVCRGATAIGPTPLIAAMRALVASVYGEEVQS